MKRFLCLLLILCMTICALPGFSESAPEEKTLKILFTHDIHSYFDVAEVQVDDEIREHGGAARLKTLLEENRDENTLYLDAGDFSMGTLLQAGFSTDAYELRLLGLLGCDVTTMGNHEFDLGGYGAAEMLKTALASGDPLPKFVQSNMILTGELTDEQQALADAMNAYGATQYTILEVNGLRVGIFGLLGDEAEEFSPTSGMEFDNYIDAAKRTVADIQSEGADVIVCLSHCGTTGDGETGEDFDLAKAVPDIDVIISGHSHSTYEEPVLCGDTIVVSAGEYLTYLGSLTLSVAEGSVSCADYRLIPCNEEVKEDVETAEVYEDFKEEIQENYLAEENCAYDEVICHSDFDFMPLDEMYKTHQEYPLGNLIADSYLYAAQQNGIDDIDVALVGLGTIRASICEGDLTVSDAFEICSLGVGTDGSAGHPLVAAYLTGKELKLITELDASLGPLMTSIKMSYSGLRYTFNTYRMPLDRAYDACIVRSDGTLEPIEDHKLYKAVCNLYAVNMLGMVNDLTRGILTIWARDPEGVPVDDINDYLMKDRQGNEIKEWIAFKDYLSSFPEKNGVPTIPEKYAAPEGRKEKVTIGGWAMIAHPGLSTIVVLTLAILLIVLIVVLCLTRKKRWARRAARRAAKRKK